MSNPMMLPSQVTKKITFPVYAFPHLRGVEVFAELGMLYFKSGMAILNKSVQSAVNWSEFDGLVGTIWDTSQHIETMQGGTMRTASDPDCPFNFHVQFYDTFKYGDHCTIKRVESLLTYAHLAGSLVSIAKPTLVESYDELYKIETRARAQGSDCFILRSPVTGYTAGKTTEKSAALLRLDFTGESIGTITSRKIDGDTLLITITDETESRKGITYEVTGPLSAFVNNHSYSPECNVVRYRFYSGSPFISIAGFEVNNDNSEQG